MNDLLTLTWVAEQSAERRAEAARLRSEAAKLEVEAVETLENVVARIITQKSLTLTRVAAELATSRDRVQGMVQRANRRNFDRMRGTYEEGTPN